MLWSTRAEDGLDSIAVIVVDWNDVASSICCLSSVHTASPDSQLILVDNHSDEDPRQLVAASLHGVRVLRLDRNRGYAGGCNAGAAEAMEGGAGYLMFLNNDATIDADTLPALMRQARQHPDSILAPKILYADGSDRVWSAGGRVVGPLLRNEHVGKDEPSSSHRLPTVVPWATGCALFMSADVFRRTGPMDEAYFLYLEDVDFCLHARSLGIETRFVPEAVVHHEVSRTLRSPEWANHVRYYAYRNKYRLAFRQGVKWKRPMVVGDALWTLAKAGLRTATSRRHRRDGYYHARTHGVLDFLRGHWGPYEAPVQRPALMARAGTRG